MIKLPNNYHNLICYWAQMLTFRCNAKCPYCILDRRGKHIPRLNELSGSEILNFWNSVEHRTGQMLSLIGGEPTLHKDFLEIVNNLEEYSITMTTNCKNSFIDQKQYNKVKLKKGSTFRINTTFHPHFISPERYIEVVKELRKTGYFIDQTSYVLYPEYPEEYKKMIDQISEEIEIYDSPYMGFWDDQCGFSAEPHPENNQPDENYQGKSDPAKLCNIVDYNVYRRLCGQSKSRRVLCWQPYNSLIVDPEGWSYSCHYKLYYAKEPICRITDFRPVNKDDIKCNWNGFCNWCDHGILSIDNPTTR